MTQYYNKELEEYDDDGFIDNEADNNDDYESEEVILCECNHEQEDHIDYMNECCYCNCQKFRPKEDE